MLTHLHTLSGHQNPIYALSDTLEDNLFLSAGNDKGVVQWSLDSMTFQKVLYPVQSSVYALHRYNDLLFTAQRSGIILVYDLTLNEVVQTLSFHKKGVFALQSIPSKNEMISTGEDGEVAVWSLSDYSLIYSFKVISDTIRSIVLSNDEKEIALGCKDGIIRIYNSADYSLTRHLTDHTLPITALQYAPNGKYMISGSRDAQLKVWKLPDYELIHNVPAHMFSIYSIVFHPTAPYFATCSQDKSIKLWDSEQFKLIKILSLEKNTPGHFHSINKLMWSRDGRYLISTGDDRQVMIWEFNA
jgi:WD40 repeat protein